MGWFGSSKSTSSKDYYGVLDIKKSLRNITSLTVEERKLVEEELMKKYKPDYKLTKSELINVIMDLLGKYRISRNDKDAVFRKFGISYNDIRKYRY